MQIRQDPVTGLWVREDGAVLMPPNNRKFRKFRWTFGCKTANGYLVVGYKGRPHYVHQLVCRAFHGLPPSDKPEIDHISRIKVDNRSCNLRFASRKMNEDNKDRVDKSLAMHGIRCCDDRKAYDRARATRYIAEKKAQGMHYIKGPDGKHHWHPRARTINKHKELTNG